MAALLVLMLGASTAQAQLNAYVTNNGDTTLSVINTATNTVTSTIQLGATPGYLAIDPARSLAYVATNSPQTVTVVNLLNNTVAAVIPVGVFPYSIALSANGAFAYVTDTSSETVTVIDTATNTVVASPAVEFSYGAALAPDGSLWVSQNSGDISVINTATNTVTSTFPTGIDNPWNAGVFTPNGAVAYLAVNGNTLVMDVATRTPIADIVTGGLEFGLAVTPDGAFVYQPFLGVGPGGVAVIDTASNTVVDTLLAGALPVEVAITPDGAFAYVTVADGTVSVINTATRTVVATVPVGGFPFGIKMARLAPTPLSQVQALIAQINALVSGGALAPNKANPLLTKLDQVVKKLNEGQTNAACGQLGAFVNQVNADIHNGTLTAAQGQALITAVNAIEASLGC